jgi:opacity protein-like surface antigen
MRKGLLTVMISAGLAVCGNMHAADFSLSAGGGGLVGGLFSRYTASGHGIQGGEAVHAVQTQDITQFNYGGFVFFDATYAELSISIQNGVNTWEQMLDVELDNIKPDKGKGWETMMGFSLLAKYPFTLTSRFSLFPLAGVEYQVALVQKRKMSSSSRIYDRTNGIYEKNKDSGALKLSDWNSLFINIGVGADFNLVSGLFIRGELLYGFRLMTPYETDGLTQLQDAIHNHDLKLAGLTSGPSFRIGLGWRFFTLKKREK